MECGCGGQILDADGEPVCERCGTVAGHGEEASPIETPATADPFNFGDAHLAAMTANPADRLGSRVADAGSVKRMAKQNRYSGPAGRSTPGAMFQVSMLRNALDMNEASSIYAAYLVRKIITSGFLQGRTLKQCTAAAVLVACRKYHVNRTMADMENASGVPRRKIFATFNQMRDAFDVTMPVRTRRIMLRR